MSTGMQSGESIKQSVGVITRIIMKYVYLSVQIFTHPKRIFAGHNRFKKYLSRYTNWILCHSIGPSMALAALGLGASIIERHFTDSRFRSGRTLLVQWILLNLDAIDRSRRYILLSIILKKN